jgi:hypothetical protein
MTDRLLTVRDLASAPGPRPGLFQLRLLERSLRARIAELDARVDALLALDGPPAPRDVADVDVLCAAIAETRELLDEARREAARHVARRHERRSGRRRWA